MKGCDACQRNKNCTEQLAGKLMPNSTPEKPWMYKGDWGTRLQENPQRLG